MFFPMRKKKPKELEEVITLKSIYKEEKVIGFVIVSSIHLYNQYKCLFSMGDTFYKITSLEKSFKTLPNLLKYFYDAGLARRKLIFEKEKWEVQDDTLLRI